jgi:hypothetical protein
LTALKTLTNFGAVQMNLVTVQNKSWWVPEENRFKLAVQVQSPDQYQAAIKDKVLALVQAEGMEKALELAAWVMEPQGVQIQPTQDPENLVEQILATVSVGEMTRAGDPYWAKPAPKAEAVSAVEMQDELDLVTFLS